MTLSALTRLPVPSFIRAGFVLISAIVWCWPTVAQESLPWKNEAREQYDTYREVPPAPADGRSDYERDAPPRYVPPTAEYDNNGGYGSGSAYNRGPDVGGRTERYYDEPPRGGEVDRRYDNSSDRADYDRGGLPRDPVVRDDYGERYDRSPSTFSEDEIISTGHDFFGSVSQGLAKVVERAFREQGRPNGYILGEDAGGAFVAGLRYGEGTLYTRDAGTFKVYWQGPTIGYDFGAEGSKTMVLVYNLRSPAEIYQRFGGVQGSAYIVGGVGLQVMKRDHVTLAPIRSGVGLRLGANVGYLKYTRSPTWNPF